MDILLTRAANRYVDRVIVAGREVVKGGRVVGVDVDEVERELLAQARSAKAYMDSVQPVLARSQATLAGFYGSGGHRRRPEAPMSTLLLRHCDRLYTCDDARTVLRDAWLLVRDGRIAALGPEPAPEMTADETLSWPGAWSRRAW